jgi:hypothetical protein
MARARKKSRARDARGHFIKKKRSAARKSSAKRKKTTRRSGVVRVKRALGRKKSTGRFVRRAKHRVRGFKRKVRGSSRKKLVRSHLSYERAPKRRSRARQEESVMAEKPRRRRKRSSAKRRHHRRAAAENPVKRKRAKRRSPKRRRSSPRRRTATAVMPAVVRRRTRKGGRRTSPATVKVVIAGLGRGGKKRRTSKRRSGAKRRASAHRRKGRHVRRRRKGVYTPASRQLSAESGFFENPLGGNFMENPLSGGELALAALTGAVGFVLADFLDRYLAVKQYIPATVPTGATAASSTSQAIDTKPSIMRIFAQAAIAAAPLAGAYWAKKPMLRAGLQGMGLGALIHLGGQLINHYVLAKLTASATAGTALGNLAQYYQQENQADTYASTSQLAGFPQGLGAPTRSRIVNRNVSVPYKEVGPRALAAAPQGVGDCLTAPDYGTPAQQPGCAPCLANDQTASVAQTANLVAQPVATSNGSGGTDATLGRFLAAYAEGAES